MKKIFAGLLVLAFFFAVNAADPSTVTNYGPLNVYKTIYSKTDYRLADSLHNVDTLWFPPLTDNTINFNVPGEWVITALWDSVGSGDSIRVLAHNYFYDGKTSVLLDTVCIDTIHVSTVRPANNVIPYGNTIFGSSGRIAFIQMNNNGMTKPRAIFISVRQTTHP